MTAWIAWIVWALGFVVFTIASGIVKHNDPDDRNLPPGVAMVIFAALWFAVIPAGAVAGVCYSFYKLGDWLRVRKKPKWLRVPSFLRPKNLEPICPQCKTKGAYR